MEVVTKVGEIISKKGTFGDWISEQLEKSNYVVCSHITKEFDVRIEVFEKDEEEA